mmetsp:Transcript_32067/g.94436  ORF Transcript_32067/g.94436 Transcript_32067/m.94436 type:complete len:214 (+) Transcript_32067:78-719(+)
MLAVTQHCSLRWRHVARCASSQPAGCSRPLAHEDYTPITSRWITWSRHLPSTWSLQHSRLYQTPLLRLHCCRSSRCEVVQFRAIWCERGLRRLCELGLRRVGRRRRQMPPRRTSTIPIGTCRSSTRLQSPSQQHEIRTTPTPLRPTGFSTVRPCAVFPTSTSRRTTRTTCKLCIIWWRKLGWTRSHRRSSSRSWRSTSSGDLCQVDPTRAGSS